MAEEFDFDFPLNTDEINLENCTRKKIAHLVNKRYHELCDLIKKSPEPFFSTAEETLITLEAIKFLELNIKEALELFNKIEEKEEIKNE